MHGRSTWHPTTSLVRLSTSQHHLETAKVWSCLGVFKILQKGRHGVVWKNAGCGNLGKTDGSFGYQLGRDHLFNTVDVGPPRRILTNETMVVELVCPLML